MADRNLNLIYKAKNNTILPHKESNKQYKDKLHLYNNYIVVEQLNIFPTIFLNQSIQNLDKEQQLN